jgi:hypothetical protein
LKSPVPAPIVSTVSSSPQRIQTSATHSQLTTNSETA